MEGNPFAGWSAASIGNCDGSVFAGNTDERPGLPNVTASFEAIATQFPDAQRIALVGTCYVVADSGLLLGDPNDAGFARSVLEYFEMEHIADAACESAAAYTDCEDPNNPHLT